ncbi:1,4-dihydroxy-6-naphthoate synthase [Thermodesulfobacteriota bacterium]
MKSLSIGFSPCPNDTYIFCGLVKGHIPISGWSLQSEQLEDVETLNEWALQGRLDITKLSFHAFGYVQQDYVLLKSGAALGRGCGPLLVAGQKAEPAEVPEMTVAVPGKYTTAAMLLQLYESHWKNVVMMRFDEIMPAIESGKVDCGVIIHESRFTYKSRGLVLIKDLGNWWEEISGYPIPLGGIAVKRSLGGEIIAGVDKALKASIAWAQRNQELCRPYIKEHAQELEDCVITDHIGLYVNAFSEDLGEEGLTAVEYFLRKGRQAKIFPDFKDDTQTISY